MPAVIDHQTYSFFAETVHHGNKLLEIITINSIKPCSITIVYHDKGYGMNTLTAVLFIRSIAAIICAIAHYTFFYTASLFTLEKVHTAAPSACRS